MRPTTISNESHFTETPNIRLPNKPHTNEENPIPDSTAYTYKNKYEYMNMHIYILYMYLHIYIHTENAFENARKIVIINNINTTGGAGNPYTQQPQLALQDDNGNTALQGNDIEFFAQIFSYRPDPSATSNSSSCLPTLLTNCNFNPLNGIEDNCVEYDRFPTRSQSGVADLANEVVLDSTKKNSLHVQSMGFYTFRFYPIKTPGDYLLRVIIEHLEPRIENQEFALSVTPAAPDEYISLAMQPWTVAPDTTAGRQRFTRGDHFDLLEKRIFLFSIFLLFLFFYFFI